MFSSGALSRVPSWSVSLSLTHHTRHTRHQRTTKRGTPSTDASFRPAERKIRVAIRQARLTKKTTPSISIVPLSLSIVFLSRVLRGERPFRDVSRFRSLVISLSSLWVVSLRSPSKSDSSTGPFFSLSRSGFFSLSLSLSRSIGRLSRVSKRDETKQNRRRLALLHTHSAPAKTRPPLRIDFFLFPAR